MNAAVMSVEQESNNKYRVRIASEEQIQRIIALGREALIAILKLIRYLAKLLAAPLRFGAELISAGRSGESATSSVNEGGQVRRLAEPSGAFVGEKMRSKSALEVSPEAKTLAVDDGGESDAALFADLKDATPIEISNQERQAADLVLAGKSDLMIAFESRTYEGVSESIVDVLRPVLETINLVFERPEAFLEMKDDPAKALMHLRSATDDAVRLRFASGMLKRQMPCIAEIIAKNHAKAYDGDVNDVLSYVLTLCQEKETNFPPESLEAQFLRLHEVSNNFDAAASASDLFVAAVFEVYKPNSIIFTELEDAHRATKTNTEQVLHDYDRTLDRGEKKASEPVPPHEPTVANEAPSSPAGVSQSGSHSADWDDEAPMVG